MLCFVQACAEFLELAQTQEKKWQKSLQFERQRRITLEETVEALAKQHNTLERACRKSTGGHLADMPGVEPGRDSDEEEELEEEEDDENAEFFDAIAEHPEGFTISVTKSRESLQSSSSELSMDLDDAKPSLSRALSDNSGNSKQEVVGDVSGSDTYDEVVSPIGREGSAGDKTNDETNGSRSSHIVTVPFTVRGSFGVNVTVGIHSFIDNLFAFFKLLVSLSTTRLVLNYINSVQP